MLKKQGSLSSKSASTGNGPSTRHISPVIPSHLVSASYR